MDNARKIPWTVPAMLVIAGFNYASVGHLDVISTMALGFVAIRLAMWTKATLEARRSPQPGDVETGEGAKPASPAPARASQAKPASRDRKEAAAKSGKAQDWKRSSRT